MADANTYCDECGASNPLQATHCFACGTALQSPAASPLLPMHTASANAAVLTGKVRGPLAPSYLLHSRYNIVSQIGTGGFGAVYQAKDTLFSHRLVAIKEMNQDGLSPPELAEAIAAFEHEALLLTDLIHPNLPRIHDHFTENGRSYVVMDFIAGDTLEDYVDKFVRRFSVEAALEIGLQLCTVLDYLHTRQPPLIFRDIKPANIMRTADNHVYLIDFGIARHFKPGKAKDTIPLGSRGYAAPEQYGKAQTTPQSDIYGLGATLHQLLTGDDPSLTLFHFEPVQLRNSPISAQFNVLLKQMVEMEMSKRPASMAIVKQELQRLLAQQTAQKPSPVVKRRNFVKGCLSVVVTCSAASAAIAITTFVAEKPNVVSLLLAHPFSGTTPVLSPAPPGPAQAMILSRPLYTYRGHKGSVTAAAWSPQGQHIASAGTLDSSVQVWDAFTGNIVLVSARKRVPARFATNGQRVDALAWSRDSTRIAAALGNETVDVRNIETGNDSLFSFSHPGNANALAWSPRGSRIAAVSGNTSIEVRSATTGGLFSTYTGHAQAVLTLAWSPDGKHIASGGADGIVEVWNATTGRTYVTYSGHSAEVQAVAWSPDSRQIASGGADGIVQVWEATTGLPLFTYRGHVGGVNAVAWQGEPLLLPAREARIASGGVDATVQVWSFGRAVNRRHEQVMTLQGEILMYRGHSGPVTSVTWSPDGQYIASGSEDGTVQVWRTT
ncbi:MAG TPA: protein kinase [Ktedonobacteraceae bacterium]|nr:protein kinase [Ktedonobacteraceae bacterium]